MQQEKISKVVLIDDEKIDRMLYSRVIKRTGIVDEVITFEYADTALEKIKQSSDSLLPIDIIFLDINMPRMNGFEFLEAATDQLGENFANIVVVMLTTSMDSEDLEKAKQYDIVQSYIQKPLTEDHVHEVRQLLKNRQIH